MANKKFITKQTGEINTFTVIVDQGKAHNPAGMEKNYAELKGLLNARKEPANPGTDYPSIEALVSATDFTDLARQKAIIVKATGAEPLTAEEKNELEGILSFLDAFQDFCVDTLGEEESRIFPNKEKSEDE